MVLTGDGRPTALACENESNAERLWGTAGSTAYPKDGIGDHVVAGADTVSPTTGTKGALWYTLTVAPGATAEVRLRLAPDAGDLDAGFDGDVGTSARREADALYAGLLGHLDDEAAMIVRQALAGMMWTKQWFHYDVEQLARRRPRRAAPARGPRPRPQPRVAPPQQRRRAHGAATPGSTRGTRRGTWPSSASPSPTSIRSSPRSSSC